MQSKESKGRSATKERKTIKEEKLTYQQREDHPKKRIIKPARTIISKPIIFDPTQPNQTNCEYYLDSPNRHIASICSLDKQIVYYINSPNRNKFNENKSKQTQSNITNQTIVPNNQEAKKSNKSKCFFYTTQIICITTEFLLFQK
jgi:hypothetical protein